MNVTATTTIHDLVDAYPYLLDWLVAYDSHFEALKNPALFATMARVAKVESAAQMAGVPADKMLDDILTEIARHEIVAQETAGAPGAPVDPQSPPAPIQRAARQEALKSIIHKLHDGVPVEQVKAEFDELIVGIDAAEIARMEQALISEGMPIEDVQRLCDVHVTVFKESLDVKPSATVAAGQSRRRRTPARTRSRHSSSRISTCCSVSSRPRPTPPTTPRCSRASRRSWASSRRSTRTTRARRTSCSRCSRRTASRGRRR